MDQETEIVTQDTRIEKIRTFFLSNKKSLISILIITILSVFGYFFYVDYQKTQKTKLGNKYNNVLIEFGESNKSEMVSELKKIIMKKDSTYSPLALYYLIDNSLVKSREEINELFDVIIEKTKLEKEIKNLIIYKKGIYNSQFIKENELIKILNPVINSESVWKPHALYLLAEYFYSKGEKQKSKEFFQNILNIENVDQNILIKAQKRIQRDFSD
tara:strand:+ start:43 stop:687 length:645 start_codon:yes stop_codon:yes gene_type:complete